MVITVMMSFVVMSAIVVSFVVMFPTTSITAPKATLQHKYCQQSEYKS
jgi:hypothetical protein